MNQEELLQRAAEERDTIVARYKKGRQGGAEIDPWEDPQFEIYHVLDRYGFIHDQHDPDKQNPAEVRLEMERVKKWLKMLRSWDTNATKEKLRKRVYKGVPNSLRGQVWSKMLNLPTVREEQSGKYQEMRELAWRWSPDIRQIDLDVNRTYRDHIMFRERYNIKQQELFNVLGAYSVYNLEIGYCQGMSQIAALLLMYLDEEDAFWALSVLVSDRKFNMHGFFIPGFPKLLRYQEHHDKIMNKFLPKLKKHLDKNGVDTGIYTLKWFFQCFLDRIPFKLTLRVWDVYLLEGERVLTAMAYNILKMHRRNLSKRGMDDILQYLQVGMYQVHLERSYEFEEDVTMESLQKCMEELRKAKLDYAGAPPSHELPKRPFGLFKEPAFEQKVGRRSSEFTTEERTAQENVMMRRELAAAAALASPPAAHNGHAAHATQRLSSGGDVTALPAWRNQVESRPPDHPSCSKPPNAHKSSGKQSRGHNSRGEEGRRHSSGSKRTRKQSQSNYHGSKDYCEHQKEVPDSYQKLALESRQKRASDPRQKQASDSRQKQASNSHKYSSTEKPNNSHGNNSSKYQSYNKKSHEEELYGCNSDSKRSKSRPHDYEKHRSHSSKKKPISYYPHGRELSTDKPSKYLTCGHRTSGDDSKGLDGGKILIRHKSSDRESKCKSSDCEFYSCESDNEINDCESSLKTRCCRFSTMNTGGVQNDTEPNESFLFLNKNHYRSRFSDPTILENVQKSFQSRRSQPQPGVRFETCMKQFDFP